MLIKGVLVSELTAIDNTLKITQTRLGVPGSTVTLNIPEGVLGIGIGNPNAEITASWAIK